MKIAITQRIINIRGTDYDCLEHGWYNLLGHHEIIPVPNIDDYVLPEVDCLILSGGDNCEQREFVETACFASAIKQEIPVVGVCHGAFVLNRWYGGVNNKIDGHQDVEHSVTLEGQQYTVNSYHSICLDKLAEPLMTVAYTNEHTEAFKHHTLPIWGLVWHPERMDTPVLPIELKELFFG
jgi:N5-(cytidine 5'-diphosphoramidyl)-L-glutamine hydrolase